LNNLSRVTRYASLFQSSVGSDEGIGEIGGLTLRRAQYSNAFGDQKFKRHYVPFNCFTLFSIQALLRSVQKRRHLFKSAYLELNTERSEVLEPNEMGFERRQALEYRIAAIEHRT
jgi:hypothetical protein